MEKIIASDLPKATSLLSDLNTTLTEATTTVDNLLEKLTENGFDTNKVCMFFKFEKFLSDVNI